MKVLGMMGALAGMAGLIWYIFIAVYHHIRKFIVELRGGGMKVQSTVYSVGPSNII
jgi:hypothetical protein